MVIAESKLSWSPRCINGGGILCTRVVNPTEQDWGKLKRLMQYLNDTVKMTRTMGAKDLDWMQTWVDVSFAVHPDYTSHTGGAISLGHGVIMTKSTKQKLNTKSTTESELVGASDYLPCTIWAKMFLEAQGHTIKTNNFAQDNESAQRLAKNGRTSSGQRSRHFGIRHFFIHDRIKTEKLNIHHCPTTAMLADFFTKPLQGALFRKFRDVIMGIKPLDALFDIVETPLEERVGNEETKRPGLEVVKDPEREEDPNVRRTYAEVVKKVTWKEETAATETTAAAETQLLSLSI